MTKRSWMFVNIEDSDALGLLRYGLVGRFVHVLKSFERKSESYVFVDQRASGQGGVGSIGHREQAQSFIEPTNENSP